MNRYLVILHGRLAFDGQHVEWNEVEKLLRNTSGKGRNLSALDGVLVLGTPDGVCYQAVDLAVAKAHLTEMSRGRVWTGTVDPKLDVTMPVRAG